MTEQPETIFATTSDSNKTQRGPNPREDQLYDQIVAAVIAKKLRPGERLNESELAKAQDLSRTRVRRVLGRLEKEQVVRFELNRGALGRRNHRSRGPRGRFRPDRRSGWSRPG